MTIRLHVKRSDLTPIPRELQVLDLVELLENGEYIPHLSNTDYAPIEVCVTVRSAYSNLVLEHTTTLGGHRYFLNSLVEKLPFPADELLIYMCFYIVSGIFESPDKISELMMKSQILPKGLYYPNDSGTAYVYFHVILKDDTVEAISERLKKDYRFIPINQMYIPENLTTVFTDTIIEVAPEVEDEQT